MKINCLIVTRTELVYALSALEEAGVYPGDRIEHASIAPDEVLPQMRRLGVTVVTQHGFIFGRGEQYLQDVEPMDQPWLYRGRGFLDAGIPLAGSTDAPYGSPDPWLAMHAACNRATDAGRFIGAQEKLTPEQALALFSADPLAPGAAVTPLAVGDDADLCLLDKNWASARQQLSSAAVAVTMLAGELVYQRDV
jgi:predicted amidohydrolase YtcJ